MVNITYSYKGHSPQLPLPPSLISAANSSKNNTQLSISKKPEKVPIKIGFPVPPESSSGNGKADKNAVLKLEEFFTQHNRIPGVDEMFELSSQLGISYLDVSKWFVQRWKNVLLAHGNENKRKNENDDNNDLHSELKFQKKSIFKSTKSTLLTFSKVQKHIFCYFKNGKKSIFAPKKCLKLC